MILEGLRVTDRIRKLDNELMKDNEQQTNNEPERENEGYTREELEEIFNTSTDESFHRFTFTRSRQIPQYLRYSQPTEGTLQHPTTRKFQKEFDEFSNQLIEKALKTKRKQFNLPKHIREAMNKLRNLVKTKQIDIRKVDKGQIILVIDYSERKKIEELNISKIASICDDQVSNWQENRRFVEEKMKCLFNLDFISRDELAAVTGILAGGANGKLKMDNGDTKFTRALDSNELFSEQRTPYVYPLLKAHKLSIDEIKQVKPDEVHQKIPARLVVGMSSCQLSRVQSWLEAFLTPLSKEFGVFEYTKDTYSILESIATFNQQTVDNDWNLDESMLFSIDVKALYPSVKLEHLKTALEYCFHQCTDWSDEIISILISIIMYTLENQQIKWNNTYWMLNQGIPTGGKHCVPLANIFLSFILRKLMENDTAFKADFENNVKIWKRFIDDIFGLFLGSRRLFAKFYKKLVDQFKRYDLDITNETSDLSIVVLDIKVFKAENQLHTVEHRKETSSNSYLRMGSAHPNYTFKGIVKSQMYRLRKLCSRDNDFTFAIAELKKRCINSGYDTNMVEEILRGAHNLEREISTNRCLEPNDSHKIRWVTLSHSCFDSDIKKFTRTMNQALQQENIRFELVKTTAPSIGRLLFNNFDSSDETQLDCACIICTNDVRGDKKTVVSSVTKKEYRIDSNTRCYNSGIYGITCKCVGQYSGKTTVGFNKRYPEHWKSVGSAVHKHLQHRKCTNNPKEVKMQFLENVWGRGKYSLSEREYLWNRRLKGAINIQKTLRN